MSFETIQATIIAIPIILFGILIIWLNYKRHKNGPYFTRSYFNLGVALISQKNHPVLYWSLTSMYYIVGALIIIIAFYFLIIGI